MRAVAHQATNLMLSLELESGKREYVEFAAGYAEINDSDVLAALLQSPLRGPQVPAHFMLLGSDEHLYGLVEKAEGPRTAPAADAGLKPFATMGLADAILQVMARSRSQWWSKAQIWEMVMLGGYESQSKNPLVMVHHALGELVKKGVVERFQRDYRIVP
ncbi:MAG: hypothetical protein ABT940_03410 [Alphaproteobacteria bacterium]